MSYVSFKYCPFCGEEMPQNNMMKFCPFCGKEFPQHNSEEQENNHKKTIAVENVVASSRENTVTRDKDEIDIDDKYFTGFLKQIGRYTFCSIMLKHAIDTRKLVRNLDKVLLRGVFAIRLAVDNMPCIILYKNKGEDVVNLVKIFMEDQASISVIPGDFNDNVTVEQIFPMFAALAPHMQQIIKKVPVKLWIGDKPLGVFPIIYRDNNAGIFAITDKNLYIIVNNNSEYQSLAISYTLLSKVKIEDRSLQFIYKNEQFESVVFNLKQDALQSFQYIRQIVQR
jgi:hypothetical protein